LIGDAKTGLDEPNEAILSSRWATKYFGKEDAIGEVLKYEGQEYRVTAIMEDFALPTRTYHLTCWFLTVLLKRRRTKVVGMESGVMTNVILRCDRAVRFQMSKSAYRLLFLSTLEILPVIRTIKRLSCNLLAKCILTNALVITTTTRLVIRNLMH
jgi:hypothetical protein